MRELWENIKQYIGTGAGALVKIIKIATLLGLVVGFFTGDWRLFALGVFTILFAMFALRGISNHIAFLSTFIPFAGELFNVDPEIRGKGEKLRDAGFPFNLFDR